MKNPKLFEDTSLAMHEGTIFANRKQLQELFGVSKKTLAITINKLRQRGAVIGKILKHSSGIHCEFYSLDEITSIGLLLKSEVAIRLQRWASEAIFCELVEAQKKLKAQQAQLDYFWDKQDVEDLHQ